MQCKVSFEKKSKVNRFCSRSCAARFNNKIYPKRGLTKECRLCTNKIPSTYTFCESCWNSEDGLSARSKVRVYEWLSGKWDGAIGVGDQLSNVIRKYLLLESGLSCQKCGFNKNHPDDNKTILEINHINGNPFDHTKENLEVICPNCHALTSSYRGRNYGNGRPSRYSN